ncbi:hypothetical protein N7486_000886 [Penicillium sp. IBT 16267x]|nr:hypothetical protein N7486_000886 [Penicillium sp. IBT 16267x]
MRLSGIQSTRLSHHVPRRIRNIPAQDADVVPNSLRKTLEAHRSSNRARLVRKIYPRTPAAGLFRPWIPPENRAGYCPSEPAHPVPDESKVEKLGKKRARSRLPETTPQGTENHLMNAIRSANQSAPEQNPWVNYLAPVKVAGDAAGHLDAEIRALDRYLAPSLSEQNQITQVSTEIKSLLEPVAPQIPQIIGSHYTGLALAHSDLNFLLPSEDLPRSRHNPRGPSATRPKVRDAHVSLLRQVESTLKNSPIFTGQVHWSTKGRPVLEARHRPTGILLRFHCGERVPPTTRYIRDYLVEYPALRPLYTGARALLESRGLFGPTQASITPEALAMLIVAFVKMNHGRYPEPGRLGDQFLDFLRLYGTDINLQSVGVAVNPPGFFGAEILRLATGEDANSAYRRGQRSLIGAKRTAAVKGNSPMDRRLCVQDPTHFMNDLGRSCTRTPELQNAFNVAHERLSRACNTWEGPERHSSILTIALQANFDELDRIRGQIVRARWISPSQQDAG